MDGFETTIVDISEEALNQLFDETPDKTVNADTLLGGKKTDKKSVKSQSQPQHMDIEDIEEDNEEEEEIEQEQKPKKAVPKAKIQPESHIEEIDIDEVEEEETEEEPKEEEEKPKKTKRAQAKETPKEEEEHPEQNDEVRSVLKSTVDFLVQNGVWDDFENREEMDIDEETYAKLVIEQDKRRVQGMFEELVDSTGPFGKAIIDYVKNGGNPDEIIDLFKEQKQVESINIETIDGQKDLIKHYYTEVMGWKPEKADKYLSNLVLSNELESEAQEVRDLFNNYYKKEAARLNSEREEFAKKQQEAEKAFEDNMRNAIKERKDLTPAERKMVESSLLSYDQRLPNGNMVNKFYVSFAKMQANPADYIDLVLFVENKERFVQKVQKQEESKATSKTWNFIKGNGSVSSKKGSSYEQVKKNEKVSNFDWGLPKR